MEDETDINAIIVGAVREIGQDLLRRSGYHDAVKEYKLGEGMKKEMFVVTDNHVEGEYTYGFLFSTEFADEKCEDAWANLMSLLDGACPTGMTRIEILVWCAEEVLLYGHRDIEVCNLMVLEELGHELLLGALIDEDSEEYRQKLADVETMLFEIVSEYFKIIVLITDHWKIKEVQAANVRHVQIGKFFHPKMDKGLSAQTFQLELR